MNSWHAWVLLAEFIAFDTFDTLLVYDLLPIL